MAKKPSQKQRVMNALWENTAVCATDFWHGSEIVGGSYMPSARNRVSELRKEGWTIVTEGCDNNRHDHETKQVQYRKVYSPECRCTFCKKNRHVHVQETLL